MIEYTIVILKKKTVTLLEGGKMGCKFMETMTRKQYPDRNAPIAADHLIPNAVPELVDPIA